MVRRNGGRDIVVVERWRERVRCRADIENLLPDRIDQIRWNFPAVAFSVVAACLSRNQEVLTGIRRIVRIPDWCREHVLKPDRLGDGAVSHNSGGIAQSLVVAEDKRLVTNNRPSGCRAKLITLPERFIQLGFVREKVAGIHGAVSKKFVNRPVQLVASGSSDSVHKGSRTAPELGGIGVR